MRAYALAHLSDRALLRNPLFIVSRDRRITAELLARLVRASADPRQAARGPGSATAGAAEGDVVSMARVARRTCPRAS